MTGDGNPHNVRLSALQHAEELLEIEREQMLHAEQRTLITLINPGEADDYEIEHYIAEVTVCERELEARYQSAFNKLTFEVAECERLG